VSAMPQGALILLAANDPVVQTLGRELLGAAGFRVITADSADEAIKIYRDYTPDLVLLAINTLDANRLEVCRHVRGGALPDTPILVSCDRASQQLLAQALEAGATDFIPAPLPWELLPFKIAYLLRNAVQLSALRRSGQRLQAVVDALPDQLLLMDTAGIVADDFGHRANVSLSRQALLGQPLEDLLPTEAARVIRDQLSHVNSTQTAAAFEFHLESAGLVREARLVPQPGDQVLAIIRDVTQRHSAEERVRRLANVDEVTGLSSRSLFMRELRRALRQARRQERHLALLYIDLDRFKRINDTLGHSVGDALLKGVAERLQGSVRNYDRLATPADVANTALFGRLGGDEFAVMLPDLEMKEQATTIANRIRQQLATPFNYQGRQFAVSASIGIAVYPDDSADVETLLMNADTAMYQAKSAGGNTQRTFEAKVNAAAVDRLALETDLRDALTGGALDLYLQPKHRLSDNRLMGAEALLRWYHPTRGWISPALLA
jgi:diguanylate cyclase (GGDEF)-like protein